MNKFFNYVLSSYFIISVTYAILVFFSIKLPLDLMQLYLILGMAYAMIALLTKPMDYVDSYILIIVCLAVLFSLISNPFKVAWIGIRYQLLAISFFFVGKKYNQPEIDFMRTGKYALLFFAIAGLYLFASSPNWYISIKTNMVSFDVDNGINSYMEMMRLSSFASYPYFVSYGSFILMTYYVSEYIDNIRTNFFQKWKWGIIGLLSIVIMLAQQRVVIFCALGVFLYLMLYLTKYSDNKSMIKHLFVISVLSVLLFYVLSIVLSNLETKQLTFLMDKITSITDSGAELVDERTSMYLDYGYSSSLWGSGIGYHSAGSWKIDDSQFIKSWYELGTLLSILFLLFFVAVFTQCIKKMRYCFFEICVFFFYFLTMIGACSLSNDFCHCMIFWWCCGRLFNRSYLQYRMNII